MSAGTNTAIALSLITNSLQTILPAVLTMRSAQAAGRDLTDAELQQYFDADAIVAAKLEADIKAHGG